MKPETTLRYDSPAQDFFTALPLGNGRLGAMIFGHPVEDRIILNESTVWSGSVQESDRPQAKDHLPAIRKLLLAGKNKEAQDLFYRHFTCQGVGTAYANAANEPFGCYQVLGSLHLHYFQALSYSNQTATDVRAYERQLDLQEAVSEVSFHTHGCHFQRRFIASHPDQAIIGRFTSDQPESIHFGISLDRQERFKTIVLDDQTLQMTGQLHDGRDGKGVRFACHVGVRTQGGKVFSDSGKIYVQGADAATLYITAATNMPGFLGRRIEDEVSHSIAEFHAVRKQDWSGLYERHLADYQPLFSRSLLQLATDERFQKQDLKRRIRSFSAESKDYGLIELYYHFARYLLISASRQGGMPCNLQGIWAEEVQTPWNGDWHLNAQQSLYWLAEKGNLSELHQPYLQLTEQLVKPGRKTAQAYYGARGWLAHTCTNPWGFTSPCEDAEWGSTTGSSAWQCHHLWEHFLYSGDLDYLSWAYPIMKEAALFYVDMLVENPLSGYLVTAPSSSPENVFLDREGRPTSLCMGPAYDSQLVRSLFAMTIEAGRLLQVDASLRCLMQEHIKRLPPIQIGSDGRIMEWLEEYEEALPHHRHLSHLWGLFPGDLLQPEQNPKLAAAAAKSLQRRGPTTAGWAIAYRFCCWAKLRRPMEAYDALVRAFKHATEGNLLNVAFHCDETKFPMEEPDLENNRYAFQLDGNQGNAAGILLLFLDDCLTFADGKAHTDIYLLPALPDALATGKIIGLRAKGGFEIDLEWEAMTLKEACITNWLGQAATVHVAGKQFTVSTAMKAQTKITV